MDYNKSKGKRIAQNTALLYFRMLFLMVITLYTSRVVLEALGVTDYGIYNVVGGFVSMFALISSSLTSACTRFLNYEMGTGNQDRLRLVFSTSVIIHYVLAIIIALLCESFGVWYINNVMVLPSERLVAANWVFQISIINFCMNLITVPYNASIIAHERMRTFAYVSVFDGIARLIICFLVMYSSYDHLIFYAILQLIIQFSVRAMYQYYCRRNFSECKCQFVMNKVLIKEMFEYSGWHIIGNTAGIANKQGVNLILNLFFGPTVNAARGVANQVHSAVSGFAGNFMMALNPQITQSYARGDIDYMLKLVYRGARFSYYVLLIISLPIIVNADYILHVWLKEVPDYAVPFVQLSLATSMLCAFSHTLTVAQNATGKVRNYQLVVGGILLLNMPLSYIALYMGANPISVMVIAFVIELGCFIGRMKIMPHNIPELSPSDYLAKVMGNCLLVTIVSSIFPVVFYCVVEISLLTFFLNSIICVIVSIFSIYYIGCAYDERAMIKNAVRNIVNKIKK